MSKRKKQAAWEAVRQAVNAYDRQLADLATVLRAYDECLVADPGAHTWRARGRFLREGEHFQLAAEAFKHAADASGDLRSYIADSVAAAEMNEQAGDTETAELIYQSVLPLRQPYMSDRKDLMGRYATFLVRQGRVDEAIEFVDNSCDQDKWVSRFEVQRSVAFAIEDIGDIERAKDHYDRAISLVGTKGDYFASIHLDHARWIQSQGDLNRAVEAYERAEFALVHTGLNLPRMREGDYERQANLIFDQTQLLHERRIAQADANDDVAGRAIAQADLDAAQARRAEFVDVQKLRKRLGDHRRLTNEELIATLERQRLEAGEGNRPELDEFLGDAYARDGRWRDAAEVYHAGFDGDGRLRPWLLDKERDAWERAAVAARVGTPGPFAKRGPGVVGQRTADALDQRIDADTERARELERQAVDGSGTAPEQAQRSRLRQVGYVLWHGTPAMEDFSGRVLALYGEVGRQFVDAGRQANAGIRETLDLWAHDPQPGSPAQMGRSVAALAASKAEQVARTRQLISVDQALPPAYVEAGLGRKLSSLAEHLPPGEGEAAERVVTVDDVASFTRGELQTLAGLSETEAGSVGALTARLGHQLQPESARRSATHEQGSSRQSTTRDRSTRRPPGGARRVQPAPGRDADRASRSPLAEDGPGDRDAGGASTSAVEPQRDQRDTRDGRGRPDPGRPSASRRAQSGGNRLPRQVVDERRGDRPAPDTRPAPGNRGQFPGGPGDLRGGGTFGTPFG